MAVINNDNNTSKIEKLIFYYSEFDDGYSIDIFEYLKSKEKTKNKIEIKNIDDHIRNNKVPSGVQHVPALVIVSSNESIEIIYGANINEWVDEYEKQLNKKSGFEKTVGADIKKNEDWLNGVEIPEGNEEAFKKFLSQGTTRQNEKDDIKEKLQDYETQRNIDIKIPKKPTG